MLKKFYKGIAYISATILIAFMFTSCKKDIATNTDTGIQLLAKETLKSKMITDQFNELNWSKASTSNYNGEEILITIPSTKNASKILYFGIYGGKALYNWVEHKNKTITNNKITETVVLSEVNGEPIKTLQIVNNKVVDYSSGLSKGANSLEKKITGDEPIIEGSGGDAVVTGYILSSKSWDFYYNLYYLLNSTAYESLYNSMESGGTVVSLPSTDPVRVKATIVNYGDHSYWTGSDTKSFMLANANVKFSLDNNFKLISGSQSVSFSGLTTFQNFIQDANQSPNVIYGGTRFMFTISGSTVISGIAFDTIISITGDISAGTIDFNYYFR